MTLESIIDNFVKSCINLDAWMFFPFLFDEKVFTDFPCKLIFFKAFISKLDLAKNRTEGELSLRVKKNIRDCKLNSFEFCFYDNQHLNERMSFLVVEENGTLFIDMHPF